MYQLYNKETTRQIEKYLNSVGVSENSLIMKSSRSILEVMNFFDVNKKVWCFCGPGNNGKDGIFLSILAFLEGRDVTLVKLDKTKKEKDIFQDLVDTLQIKSICKVPNEYEVSSSDIIVDAILGIGINRKPKKKIKKAIELINLKKKEGSKVLSIDVPSGLDSHTGLCIGVTVKADYTVMCLTRKQGCYTGEAAEYVGKLKFADLGLRDKISKFKGNSSILNFNGNSFFNRSKISYKGTLGSVLVLGGWNGMEGAGFLSSLAALKVGAGKVFLCGPEREKIPFEVIRIEKNISSLRKIFPKINCIIAGPGLGENGHSFLKEIWSLNIPLLFDADALNWLAKNNLPKRKGFFCGTPHMGEAYNLIGFKNDNRFEILSELKKKFGGIWVLKGPGTLIGHNSIYVNPFSNSILSTAGSGDILAGIIGGLISQKVKNPVNLGVLIHSNAARKSLKEGKRSIFSSELLNNISLLNQNAYNINDELIKIR